MTLSASAAVAPTRRVPGEGGTWVFLFGDMLVFGAFFATFMVERAKAPEVFDAARKTLHLGVGLINTLLLLTSSLCIVVALRALRSGARLAAARAIVVAMTCGGVFIALKMYEYTSLVTDGHGIGANHFYLYYFILTGVHLFHVCVGVGVLAFLLTQTRRHELSDTRMAVVEGGTCFWHLVDLLWIVLFPLLYLVA
ncbi:cytochrome c oxidase subunit 3 [Mycobacterium sp. 21AC1]|nr:cytochrome c oxidase subunit 3 [Mycobacterium sp. 21AC1]MDV3124592.1 cytochrome c oxidase subunit 3 [Mycobacterium sp. 21AC1]